MAHDSDKLPSPTYCPYCGYLVDHAMIAFEDNKSARPEAGSVNLCMACGEMSLFDASMMLRRPTMSEYVWLTNLLSGQLAMFRQAREKMVADRGPVVSSPGKN
jgi:hypothetical protein